MKYILGLFLLYFVSNCTTIGHSFDLNKVKELRPGISTTQDAKILLGKPTSTSVINNDTLLQWQYIHGTPTRGRGKHVAILFDKNGKMIRVTHQTEL